MSRHLLFPLGQQAQERSKMHRLASVLFICVTCILTVACCGTCEPKTALSASESTCKCGPLCACNPCECGDSAPSCCAAENLDNAIKN